MAVDNSLQSTEFCFLTCELSPFLVFVCCFQVTRMWPFPRHKLNTHLGGTAMSISATVFKMMGQHLGFHKSVPVYS